MFLRRNQPVERLANDVVYIEVDRGNQELHAGDKRKGRQHDRPGGRGNSVTGAIVPSDAAYSKSEGQQRQGA